ncbi:hypothetical protein Cgig2_001206 [Carnegiea gigantea]|uniref:Pentatricopeptide repeat-containing protein n=1 Tax=Carnegiea gigantea TaxID=171969 RepID=A0A9Q1K030_9CARY|nr:hypothetical protein Cgig2_001206 [Carnegiea gigantea]
MIEADEDEDEDDDDGDGLLATVRMENRRERKQRWKIRTQANVTTDLLRLTAHPLEPQLLPWYAKFNLQDKVQKLFDEMPQENVVSRMTMISTYSNAKKGNKALEFLTLLLHESSFIGVYKYDLESDVVVRGALINVHARWGELGNALAVFNEFMTGDLVVWNSIIGAFAQNSVGDEASFIFKRMKRAGFQAEQATLTSTLRAVTSLALLELGRQVLVHVLKYDQDLILNNALL